MKKSLVLLIAIASQSVFATPMTLLEQHGCSTIFEELASTYLSQDDIISSFATYKSVQIDSYAIENLKLVAAQDLQPGSFGISRIVTLENNHLQIKLLSKGNLYCDDEKIITIVDLKAF